MHRKHVILTVMVIAILAGAAVSVALRAHQAGGSSGSITMSWLNRELAAWKPSTYKSLLFGVQDLRASYGIPSYDTMQVQNADLNMLISTNATSVRLDIGYAPWLSNDTSAITLITKVVDAVKASGKALVIADASSESYRHGGQLSWAAFKYQWVLRVQKLASLFHPYAYIVVKEPGWYFPMISDSLTNPDVHNPYAWANLTGSLIRAVNNASPGTKVGVSVAAYDLYNSSYYQGKVSFNVNYLIQVEKIAPLDFIGFDIYDTQGFNDTLKFLSEHGSGGKAIWIAEAWSGDGQYIHDSSRSALDSEWMQLLYYFAVKINASAVFPFYTDFFSSYAWNTNSTDIVNNYSLRQPVYCEFHSLASSYGIPA